MYLSKRLFCEVKCYSLGCFISPLIIVNETKRLKTLHPREERNKIKMVNKRSHCMYLVQIPQKIFTIRSGLHTLDDDVINIDILIILLVVNCTIYFDSTYSP